jgi:signal peptidase I
MMIKEWFMSGQARHALALRRHVHKLLRHQVDLLAPKAVEELQTAMQSVQSAVAEKAKSEELDKKVETLEKAAEKWLKPYPNATLRENIEVLLVALAVAMAIRTFFLQPFKIPTGSMQPTLFGVTSVPDFSKINPNPLEDPQLKERQRQAQTELRDKLVIPTGWQRVKEWFQGISYIHKVAEQDGNLQSVDRPFRILIFNIRQTIHVGNRTYTIWFPPDYGSSSLEGRAGISIGQGFRKGEDIVKMKVQAGDHLFVNRLTYNFCPPRRGDIVVFATAGIPEARRGVVSPPIPADQFYIKRLTGLSGETLVLQKDYDVFFADREESRSVGHLMIDGRPLSASTPHFANLYSFQGARPGTNVLVYEENRYFGHALLGELGPDSRTQNRRSYEFRIRPNHLFVMGDNTMNSLDSRYWGDFPADVVIGKSLFVYWPLTERFGWGQR